MKEKRVKVKVFSDRRDTTSVTTIVKQISINNTSIICQAPEELKIEQDDIIIFLVNSIQSSLLEKFKEQRKHINNQIIIVTKNESALLISSLAKDGFTNIFLFPQEISGFISFLTNLIENNNHLSEKTSEDYDFSSIIGESEKIKSIKEIAGRVSENSTINILILGETGTGKGLLAKAIHKNSSKGNKPFIEIVCSAIPEELLESELFGYEKGAFTNALQRKLGLFELAEEGTLFLDEIGDLSLNLQVKLLRVIEKKVIRRLGGIDDIPVNTRIISATNKDLNKMVEENLFRSDLYHRLNVVSILLPPLRERGNDILLLAEKFMEEFNELFNKNVDTFEEGLKEFLLNYTWPGNIRELRNAMERAVLLSDDNILRMNDFEILLQNLPLNILEKKEHISFHPNLIRLDLDFRNMNLFKLSKLYAKEVFRKMGGNKTKSAQVLGISRPKLDKLLNGK